MANINAVQQTGNNPAKPSGLTPAETLAILCSLTICGKPAVSTEDRTLPPADLAKKLISTFTGFGIKPDELPRFAQVVKQSLVQGKIGRDLNEEALLSLANLTRKTSDPHREINDASVKKGPIADRDVAAAQTSVKEITRTPIKSGPEFDPTSYTQSCTQTAGCQQTLYSLSRLDPEFAVLVNNYIQEQKALG